MAKGHERNQMRLMALHAMGKDLARRAKSRCELTGAAGVPLRPYEVPPVPEEPDFDRTLMLCDSCIAAIERPGRIDGREWHCLAEAVWSENPALQVVAWRLLRALAEREGWAREALEGLQLDEETEAWARAE